MGAGAGSSSKYKGVSDSTAQNSYQAGGTGDAPGNSNGAGKPCSPESQSVIDVKSAKLAAKSFAKADVNHFIDGLLGGSDLLVDATREEFGNFLLRLLTGNPFVATEARDLLKKTSQKAADQDKEDTSSSGVDEYDGGSGTKDGNKKALDKTHVSTSDSRNTQVSFAAEDLLRQTSCQSTESGFRFKDNTPAATFDLQAMQVIDEEAMSRWQLFSWLDWAPVPGSPSYNALHKCFPGALPSVAVQARVSGVLQKEYSFSADNTLFGLSICPDEINNRKGGLANAMTEFWGEVFPLGGISGAPFVGKTGFSAFSNHVPDGGNILILYGPHIAISDCGEVGKYLREGQSQLSTACGAVIGAYNACCGVNQLEEDFDEADMQMAWIKAQLLPHVERIKAQPNPLAELAYQSYEMVKSKMGKIVNHTFGTGSLALVGGIQINMPFPYEDHFLPLSFNVSCSTQPTRDLLHVFTASSIEPTQGLLD